MSAVAALLTAATSWVLVAGFCILGWISVPEMKVSSVLQLGTQGWLLAHGISVGLPGAQLSIIPLGLTAVIAALGLGLSAQAVIHSPPPDPGLVGARLGRLAAVYGLTYVVVLTIARSWTEGGRAGQSSLLWAAALVFGLGLVGFARALAWQPPGLPPWLRAGAWGVVAGLCVLVVSGVAVVVTALISGRDRVGLVHESLDPGGLGGTMLLLGQLAWLPNYIAWGGRRPVGSGYRHLTCAILGGHAAGHPGAGSRAAGRADVSGADALAAQRGGGRCGCRVRAGQQPATLAGRARPAARA
ncbi:MAG: DUF6350 family protein, partial [Propionibacteriaceae bacterium]|nr:DUF6350 family protein [Propionibacteriaceae bacterium]